MLLPAIQELLRVPTKLIHKLWNILANIKGNLLETYFAILL